MKEQTLYGTLCGELALEEVMEPSYVKLRDDDDDDDDDDELLYFSVTSSTQQLNYKNLLWPMIPV